MPSAVQMEYEIVLQHADFVVINKPVGVAVHQDDGDIGLLAQVAAQLNVPRLWLVHRLDKVTSGVLLLAKNAAAASELAQQFADKKVQKTYLALSEHKPLKKQGWVRGDMQKSRRGAYKLCRSQNNPAITQFFSRSIAPNWREFELHPHTGKTHQLRVAMKSLGSPIFGDELYGGTPATRVFLHACRLQFNYCGQTFIAHAPVDALWQAHLALLNLC
ncbi:MAG: TIGR01621 family pseudouridine synthase [Neisseria sp.]|nr:TIGR01621 family pseudouridine synthase [Neisseria sp.]